MGMIIYNNTAALFALNENKKNEKGLAKTLKKAASGMKLNSAGDDASGYSISEKLRVKLRALDQNDRNVKNGTALLQTASGAVQEQVSLLKTIRQKVIDANNDTNTEADRATIQKEIDQYYDQMSDIVYNTEYNGEKILMGNSVAEIVSSWDVLQTPVLAENSEIEGLFPDLVHPNLDGLDGPFATFGKADTDYDGYKQKRITPTDFIGTTGNTNGAYFTNGKENELKIKLAGMNKSSLEDTAFKITYPTNSSPYYENLVFVLTTDSSANYPGGAKDAEKIDISGCTSNYDIAGVIKSSLEKYKEITDNYDIAVNYDAVTGEGPDVVLTTKTSNRPNSYTEANNANYYNIEGIKLTGIKDYPPKSLWGSDGKFKGGVNAVYDSVTVSVSGSDSDAKPGTITKWEQKSAAIPASIDPIPRASINASDALTIHYCEMGSVWDDASGGRRYNVPAMAYMILEDGDGYSYDEDAHCYHIGRNWTGTFGKEVNMIITIDSNNITAVADIGNCAADANAFYFEDGIKGTKSAGKLDNVINEQNGKRAHWDIDLSSYGASDVEQVIKDFLGKTIKIPYHSSYDYFEFIDTGSANGMDAIPKYSYSSSGNYLPYTIDLDKIREYVKQDGKSVAEAFADVVHEKMSSPQSEYKMAADGTITGIQICASGAGKYGEKEYVEEYTAELRHYTIDWQNWVDTQGITDIPAALHEKGFRFYCATDSSQWVNVRFVNGEDELDKDRPTSGNAGNDISTVTIDLTQPDLVTDVKSLVEAINKQLGDHLNKYKHNFNITFDSENGTTTIYDERRYNVRNENTYPDRQEKGAKIGNGMMDNVLKSTRDIYVNDLVIQHTDKSSMNIHVKIPQTSLDQIFGYKEGSHHISEYNVMTKEMREKLLGVPPDKGILDKGVDYLLDAQTLIGAQIVHMEIADDNITAQQENTASAESVIRDADMARTMME